MSDPEYNLDVYEDFESPSASEIILQLDSFATEMFGDPSVSRPNSRAEVLFDDGKFIQISRKLISEHGLINSYSISFSTLFDVEIDNIQLEDESQLPAAREIIGKGLFVSAQLPDKELSRLFATASVEVDEDGDIEFSALARPEDLAGVVTLLSTDLLVIGAARRAASQ